MNVMSKMRQYVFLILFKASRYTQERVSKYSPTANNDGAGLELCLGLNQETYELADGSRITLRYRVLAIGKRYESGLVGS